MVLSTEIIFRKKKLPRSCDNNMHVVLLVPECTVNDHLVFVEHLKNWHIFAVRIHQIASRHHDAWIFLRNKLMNFKFDKRKMDFWCVFAEFPATGLLCYDFRYLPLPKVSPQTVAWVNIMPVGLPMGTKTKQGFLYSKDGAYRYRGKIVNGGTLMYVIPFRTTLSSERVWKTVKGLDVIPLTHSFICNKKLHLDGLPRVALNYPYYDIRLLQITRDLQKHSVVSTEYVDAVVLWVDATDVKWQNSYSAAINPDSVPRRRYGHGSRSLKACLRSLHFNVPFIREIYLITADQTPDWFVNNQGLTIISHRDVFPDTTRTLPTFNSSAIETIIHRIPGLSPYFLYSNDDMFVLRPTTHKDWFFNDGRARVFEHHAKRKTPSSLGPTTPTAFDLQMFHVGVSLSGPCVRPAHQVSMHHKDACAAVEIFAPHTTVVTRYSHVRTEHPFHVNITQYTAQLLMCKLNLGMVDKTFTTFKDNIYVDPSQKKLSKGDLHILKNGFGSKLPMLFCMNDHGMNEQRAARYFSHLDVILPHPAPWEK